MKKNIYDNFNDLNIEFFEKVKTTLQDPLGLKISNDVSWIKLNEKWNSSQFPVVTGGVGQPILLLHGFDSSFLEFRRIYPFLKNDFQIIIPDLLGFGFSPRIASNIYDTRKIISNLIDIIESLKIKKS